jgi:hypothetical protein
LRERIDLALLLTARGASAAEVGREFGVSGKTVERVVAEIAREEYTAAVRARPLLRSDHGTRYRYNKRNCRCPDCTEANTEWARARRTNRNPSSHGTASAYQNFGCRCAECREAGKSMNARTQAKIRSGEFQMAHGTAVRFWQGCRCSDCEAAEAKRTARASQRNARTVDGAWRHRQQWTGPELEVALMRDANGDWLRSTAEVAAMIGRSLFAVQVKRGREKDPRVGRIAGVT